MTGRMINASDYRRMRWKNGGGETVEVAIDPPGAGLDSFGWRISMATIGSDGPFSAFPGTERTLFILSGAGISLVVGNNDPVKLDTESAPFTFPADTTAEARLIDGPVTDFNVMTRSRDWRHTVRRVRMDAGAVLPTDLSAAHTLVFCQSGAFEAHHGSAAVSLAANATLWIEHDDDPWVLRTDDPGTIYVVEIKVVEA